MIRAVRLDIGPVCNGGRLACGGVIVGIVGFIYDFHVFGVYHLAVVTVVAEVTGEGADTGTGRYDIGSGRKCLNVLNIGTFKRKIIRSLVTVPTYNKIELYIIRTKWR